MVSVELLVKLKGEEKSFALFSISIKDDRGMALESAVGVNDINSWRGWSSCDSSNFFALFCHCACYSWWGVKWNRLSYDDGSLNLGKDGFCGG
jgi:hypothetical protein